MILPLLRARLVTAITHLEKVEHLYSFIALIQVYSVLALFMVRFMAFNEFAVPNSAS